MDGRLVIIEGRLLLRFCCSYGWYADHRGRHSFATRRASQLDGSLVFMEGSLLSRFFILQWIVVLSLWKVVSCEYFCYSNDGTLVIMEGSLLSRFLLLQCMVALSL